MFRYRFRLESNKSIKQFLEDNKLDYTPVSYLPLTSYQEILVPGSC